MRIYLIFTPIYLHLFLLDFCIESLGPKLQPWATPVAMGHRGPPNIIKGGPTNRQRGPGQMERLGFRLNPRFSLIIPLKSIAPITKNRVILEKPIGFSRMLRFFEAIPNSEGLDCPPILNSGGAAAGAILNSECLGSHPLTHSLTHPLTHTHTPTHES